MANEKHIDALIKAIEEEYLEKQLRELNGYLATIAKKLDDIDKSIHKFKSDLMGYFFLINGEPEKAKTKLELVNTKYEEIEMEKSEIQGDSDE
jgi:hypothetical protein